MTDTAFLVMDVQPTIVDRFDTGDGYLERLAGAVAAARAARVPVIYVVVELRSESGTVSKRNKAFARTSALGLGAEVHPALAPEPDEPVVLKRRVSAFAGSDLDLLLRAKDIRSLVLAGIATSGVVLSTVRAAADLDFALTVLSDGCLDADAEVHRVLTEKIFPRQADVVTTAEWTATLDR